MPTASVIYACKNKSSGTIRIVKKKTTCKSGEKKLSWNTTGPQGPQGPVGPAGATGATGATGAQGIPGLSFVAQLSTSSTVAIGTASPPPAPAGYTLTAALQPAKYLVVGDLTVQTPSSNTANLMVICRTYVGNTVVSVSSDETIPIDGRGNLAIATTFDQAAAATVGISFRCYNNTPLSGTANYWFLNMSLYRVG